MTTNAIAAFGTLIKLGNGTGTAESFTTIAEVGDIDGPADSVDTIEVTSHSSPQARKEFIASLIDSGEISFPMWFVPTDSTQDAETGLQYYKNERLAANFQMVFPDDTQVAFSALVTKFGMKAPVSGVLSADVTLKITGAMTWS
jgi:hypothetical protein